MSGAPVGIAGYHVEPRIGGPHGCWSSWTVRPFGGKKGIKTFSYRKKAIAFAEGLKRARFVVVHKLDGTVHYVRQTGR